MGPHRVTFLPWFPDFGSHVTNCKQGGSKRENSRNEVFMDARKRLE